MNKTHNQQLRLSRLDEIHDLSSTSLTRLGNPCGCRKRDIGGEPGTDEWTFALCLGQHDGNYLLLGKQQSQAIMDLIEQHWHNLVGYTPMKICFPALEGRDWQVITGSDPKKNIPWSYHNGGNWPVLVWMLVAAAVEDG